MSNGVVVIGPDKGNGQAARGEMRAGKGLDVWLEQQPTLGRRRQGERRIGGGEESIGGVILVLVSIVAIIWANSSGYDLYHYI